MRRSHCDMPRKVFVTVGSTRFPGLIKAVLLPETIEVLQGLGYGELRIQYGTDDRLFLDQTKGRSNDFSITGFDYSPSIEKEIQQADLIISHAGIHSLLDYLMMKGLGRFSRHCICGSCLSSSQMLL